MSTYQIEELAQEIYTQCGMRVNVTKTWSEFGMAARVQVHLVDDADPDKPEHWQFFQAWNASELPRLRGELAAFIAENRKKEAA